MGRKAPRPAPGRHEIFGMAAIVIVVTVSNYLVRFTIGDWLTWGAFFYPVTFLVVDCVNRVWGAAPARRVILAGFFFALPSSFLFNLFTPQPGQGAEEILGVSARIAVASASAFLVAQLLDVRVFNALRGRAWWVPPVGSSVVGSVCDTFLFFFAAFAFTGLPWVTLATGDLIAKGTLIALLLPGYRLIVRRILASTRDTAAA